MTPLVPLWLLLSQAPRQVAVTFDDLPATRFVSVADARQITGRLLGHLRLQRIPAIGFVNEVKLGNGPDSLLVALLDDWLEAGMELGNHTHSHRRLYDTPLAEFEADVLLGERVTRRLVSARGDPLRYFRHPTLNTGPDRRTKEAFEQFLAARGYLVAPVTIDTDEYLYALAYDRVRARGDSAGMARIGAEYIEYMGRMFGYFEELARKTLGREPAQILLLHANALNADHFPGLAAMIAARGYRFVSLERALEDSAYRLPDRYIGPRGPSWLIRWALTMGRTPAEPPAVPARIRDLGAALPET